MHARLFTHPARCCAGLLLCAWLAGCATTQAPPRDDSAFLAAKPASILALPPVNESAPTQASDSVLAQATYPLAEGGYYVMPVALVKESFRHNGMQVPDEIHQVAPARLREIFGADAALYIQIKRYGTVYQVIDSATVVSAEARLVDLRSGSVLWTGEASASNKEGGNASGGGLTGMLISALVQQILDTAMDTSHDVAGIATRRLLGAGGPRGLLPGPRLPLPGRNWSSAQGRRRRGQRPQRP